MSDSSIIDANFCDVTMNTNEDQKITCTNARKMLREEFSSDNIRQMTLKRAGMESIAWHWAICSFNSINNQRGTCGGVYEIKEGHEIIYISGLPQNVHIRDALNAHFSGHDGLPLGSYLTDRAQKNWSNFYVRFMPSKSPSDDARLLLRYYQLRHMGRVPRFN